MTYAKPKTTSGSEKLNAVLKHMPKASEMPTPGDPAVERGKQYKAVDGGGNVFIMTHPCTWPVSFPEGSNPKIHRPKPIPYDAAVHEVSNQRLPALPGGSNQRHIEW